MIFPRRKQYADSSQGRGVKGEIVGGWRDGANFFSLASGGTGYLRDLDRKAPHEVYRKVIPAGTARQIDGHA